MNVTKRFSFVYKSRNRYLRPIKIAILLSLIGELFIFLVFGLILFPQGNLFNKLIWIILYCSLGMGSVVGAFVNFLVVERWKGIKAVLITTGISFTIIGVFCNILCLNLDRHFGYFGALQSPGLFAGTSIVGSILIGLLMGILIFNYWGMKVSARFGL